ncbi:MAG: PQQ-binding-like beta-propeller repeat protein [Planctomycetota bacterium]
MTKRLVWAVVVFMLFITPALAEWPQYLGPGRDGISPETGLARAWPQEGPKVAWTFPLGQGFAGPAVSGGKVYLLDREGDEKDVLRCIDLDSGKEDWNLAYDAPGEIKVPGSRSVPAIDEKHIYTCGPFGDVHCVDKAAHKAVWRKNVLTDFGGQKPPTWGVSQSPLIYGDLLIVASQTPKAGVVAYDKATGDVKWASPPLAGKESYVSPMIVQIAGQDHLVMISAMVRAGGRRGRRPADEGPPEAAPKGGVVGIDPKTGKMLWSYDGWQCSIPVPNATPIGDGRLFLTGGYKAGSAMIRVEKKGEGFAATEVYKTQAFGTHVHPALLYKDHLYGQCTTNTGPADGLMCMDLDGNVKWKTEKSPLFDKGGAILADGLIFTVDGNAGVLYLIDPTPEGFKPLASAKLLDTNRCWAPLALSDGRLLIRDQKQMKCVIVR